MRSIRLLIKTNEKQMLQIGFRSRGWVFLTDCGSQDTPHEKWKCLFSKGLDSSDNLWVESSSSVVSRSLSSFLGSQGDVFSVL